MTRTVRLPLAVMAAMLIAAMWFASAAQAQMVAQAQTVCEKRADMVRDLEKIYREVRRGAGMAGAQAIVELYTNEATGSWTILQTTPNGVTCLVATGDNWHDEPAELTPTGDPA